MPIFTYICIYMYPPMYIKSALEICLYTYDKYRDIYLWEGFLRSGFDGFSSERSGDQGHGVRVRYYTLYIHVYFTHIYMYMYMYICVYMCIWFDCFSGERPRDQGHGVRVRLVLHILYINVYVYVYCIHIYICI
jgi:hypothetical protein